MGNNIGGIRFKGAGNVFMRNMSRVAIPADGKIVCNIVDKQPTAYDVDKVVSQLSERQYEDECYPCSLVVDFEEAEKIVRAGGFIKYRCIKELCVPKCDGNGFEIPNEFFYVEVGSEWQRDTRTSICGGEIHLDRINVEGDHSWIEISWETLEEAFELIKV